MTWLKEQIEFADGGPVMPVGCRVVVYDPRDHKIPADEVNAVKKMLERLEKEGHGEKVLIVHGKHLSAVPRRITTTNKPEVETEAFMRREHGNAVEG